MPNEEGIYSSEFLIRVLTLGFECKYCQERDPHPLSLRRFVARLIAMPANEENEMPLASGRVFVDRP